MTVNPANSENLFEQSNLKEMNSKNLYNQPQNMNDQRPLKLHNLQYNSQTVVRNQPNMYSQINGPTNQTISQPFPEVDQNLSHKFEVTFMNNSSKYMSLRVLLWDILPTYLTSTDLLYKYCFIKIFANF